LTTWAGQFWVVKISAYRHTLTRQTFNPHQPHHQLSPSSSIQPSDANILALASMDQLEEVAQLELARSTTSVINSKRIITLALLRKRSEHNEGLVSSLEELALHQEELQSIGPILGRTCGKTLKILLLQNNVGIFEFGTE